jgi:hypothetical protein
VQSSRSEVWWQCKHEGCNFRLLSSNRYRHVRRWEHKQIHPEEEELDLRNPVNRGHAPSQERKGMNPVRVDGRYRDIQGTRSEKTKQARLAMLEARMALYNQDPNNPHHLAWDPDPDWSDEWITCSLCKKSRHKLYVGRLISAPCREDCGDPQMQAEKTQIWKPVLYSLRKRPAAEISRLAKVAKPKICKKPAAAQTSIAAAVPVSATLPAPRAVMRPSGQNQSDASSSTIAAAPKASTRKRAVPKSRAAGKDAEKSSRRRLNTGH